MFLSGVLQNTDQETKRLLARLESTEQRQQQMMAFLAKAVQNPAFLQELLTNQRHAQRISGPDKSARPSTVCKTLALSPAEFVHAACFAPAVTYRKHHALRLTCHPGPKLLQEFGCSSHPDPCDKHKALAVAMRLCCCYLRIAACRQWATWCNSYKAYTLNTHHVSSIC